jgi:hypothetical protein
MKAESCFVNATRLALATMLVGGLAVSANAQTVLIDFGRQSSFRGVTTSSPDINGNSWNSIVPGPFIVNLVDTSGAATAIDLGFSTPVGTDSFNGPAGVTSFPNPTAAEIAATDIDAAALGLLGIKEAAIDFAAGDPDSAARFELQQLDPSKRYNITFFGSHKFSANDTTVYSIYTDNTYSALVASASLDVQMPGSPNLHNRDQVATLYGIAPQASNILYVEFVGSAGGNGYLNSMQITAVPEPSTLLLLVGCVGMLFGIRRR